MSTPSNKSIIKAFGLLEIVCDAPGGLTLREAASAARLSVATTHRILTTMKCVGAINCSQDGTYTLGALLLAVHARNTLARQAVQAAVEAHMTGLLSGPATSVRLSVLDSDEIYIFAGLDNGVSPKMRSKIGARYEAYCTAPGKVLLAGLSGRKLDNYVFNAGFVKMTSNTIVVPSRLANEINRVLECGYAFDNGEFIDGVRCLAVPVRSADRQVIAALSIAGEEMALTCVPHLAARLAVSAGALARKLGEIPGSLRALQHRIDTTVP